MTTYLQSVAIYRAGITEIFIVGEEHNFFGNAATITKIYYEGNEVIIDFDDKSTVIINGYPFIFQVRIKE
jgi:hypothetical protein